MKHPSKVIGYNKSLEELAKAIGNMTYDQTASFIEKLAEDIKRQADCDASKGREKLSSQLYQTAEHLYNVKEDMEKAWNTCAPYMKGYNGKK